VAGPEALDKTDLSEVIPPEAVNRFAAPILVLHPLHREDYRIMLAQRASRIDDPLRALVSEIGERSIRDAEMDDC
jgi:hypothetical protein